MNSSDFDDDPPALQSPLPADPAARADFGEPPNYADPPRSPLPALVVLALAFVWAFLYWLVNLFLGLGLAFAVFGLFLAFRPGGGDLLKDGPGLDAWMKGPESHVPWLIIVAGSQFGGLLLSWVLLRFIAGKSWKRKIALTRGPTWTHAALVLIGIPAMIAVSMVVEIPLSKYVPTLGELMKRANVPIEMESTTEMISKMVQFAPWSLAIFAVAVSPGICEEVFCRGFLAHWMSSRWSNWVVVLTVSFLFGCIHTDPQQGVGAMLLGAAIHGAYLATRTLWVPMFIHFANNGLAVVHMNDRLYPVLDIPEGAKKEQLLLFTVAAIFFFAAVVYALYQTRCRLAPAVEGLQGWRPEGVSGVELPPPNSGTVVTHEPLSPVSAALVAVGALGFGVVLVLA